MKLMIFSLSPSYIYSNYHHYQSDYFHSKALTHLNHGWILYLSTWRSNVFLFFLQYVSLLGLTIIFWLIYSYFFITFFLSWIIISILYNPCCHCRCSFFVYFFFVNSLVWYVGVCMCVCVFIHIRPIHSSGIHFEWQRHEKKNDHINHIASWFVDYDDDGDHIFI